MKSVIFFFCIYFGFPGSLTSADPYCFKLTWVGPSYTNESGSTPNITNVCQSESDFCTKPWVYTHDGSPPNFDKLWEDNEGHPDNIACKQSGGYVCVKWTNYFDGKAQYTTHTCAKIAVEGEGAMTSGCETSTVNNSRTTEVCACTSYDGKPCNSGHHPYTSITVTGLLMVFFLALKCVT